MADQAIIEESIKAEGLKPIFSDGFLIGFRFKTKPKQNRANLNPANLKPEDTDVISGLIEMTFVDESKQMALGRFIIDRETAENLSNVLVETIKRFDQVMGKGGLSKLMPKNAEKADNKSYR
ncbi:MAG: hypothetical protein ABSE71_03915 [Candidatus Micrarchaeaceae archaeon]|jgi:hypothetical protein|nr:hypothetical protein [Candidatus Micrarchaeota archaeon]HII10304.1 hypothetical protein [Candidatus Micrarchaeota archaeon]